MVKEPQNQEIVMDTPKLTIKNTAFSKKDYEWIVTHAMDMIRVSRKNKWDKETVADLHGFFYASMAGLIRSGTLCSRDNAVDGFPEIHAIIQDTDYHCRENVLYAILGKDAEEVIIPYEDNSHSYAIDVNNQNLSSVAAKFEKTAPGAVDDKKHRNAINDLIAAQKEIEDLKNQLLLNDVKNQKELVAVKSELKAVKENKQFLEDHLKKDFSGDHMMEIQNQLIQTANELAQSKVDLEKARMEKAEADQQIEKLQGELSTEQTREREEPKEYEYYYKEILPKMAYALGSNGGGFAVKLISALVSVCAIAVAIWIMAMS